MEIEVNEIVTLLVDKSPFVCEKFYESGRFTVDYKDESSHLIISTHDKTPLELKVPIDEILDLMYAVIYSKTLKLSSFYQPYPNVIEMLSIARYLIVNLCGSINGFSTDNVIVNKMRRGGRVSVRPTKNKFRRGAMELRSVQWMQPKPPRKRNIQGNTSVSRSRYEAVKSNLLRTWAGDEEVFQHEALSMEGGGKISLTHANKGYVAPLHARYGTTKMKQGVLPHKGKRGVKIKVDAATGNKRNLLTYSKSENSKSIKGRGVLIVRGDSSRYKGKISVHSGASLKNKGPSEKPAIRNEHSIHGYIREGMASRKEQEILISVDEFSPGKDVINVHFATNRKDVPTEEFYSGEKSDELKFGRAEVLIPDGHKTGKVERPLVFFKEKVGDHFVINDFVNYDEDDFYSCLTTNSQRLVIFIHGYNVTFCDAVYQAAQIKKDLFIKDDSLMLFSWPSRGKWSSYGADKESAEYSASFLANILEEIERKKSENKIDEVLIVAHSMGSMCLAKALNKAKLESNAFQRVALSAADIEEGIFIKDYAQTFMAVFEQFTNYVSSNDRALWASEFYNEGSRVGYVKKGIVALDGMETIDMSKASGVLSHIKHSYSFQVKSAVTDLHQYLINGVNAADRQLTEMKTKQYIYWELPK